MKNVNISSIIIYFAILLFLSTNIYLCWSNSLLNILQVSWGVGALYYILNKSLYIEKQNILLACLFSIAFFIYSQKISANIFASVYFSITPLVILLPLTFKRKVCYYFCNSLFPILLLISIIAYLLVGLHIVSLPNVWIPPFNPLKDYGYINYFFFLAQDNTAVLSRFHSFYDEPGVIGTLSAIILFLYYDILDIKSKGVYIIAGILSFSLYFYLILLYLCLIKKIISTNNIKWILLSSLLVYFLLKSFDDDFLKTQLFDRLTIQNGKLAGDNRTNEYFSYFFWNDFIYRPIEFIFGTNDIIDKGEGGASILITIYKYGFLWVFYIVSLYLLFFYKYRKNNKDFICVSLLFLSMIYQRPYLVDISYFILFLTAIESSSPFSVTKKANKLHSS